jgi:hypothetical protein
MITKSLLSYSVLLISKAIFRCTLKPSVFKLTAFHPSTGRFREKNYIKSNNEFSCILFTSKNVSNRVVGPIKLFLLYIILWPVWREQLTPRSNNPTLEASVADLLHIFSVFYVK